MLPSDGSQPRTLRTGSPTEAGRLERAAMAPADRAGRTAGRRRQLAPDVELGLAALVIGLLFGVVLVLPMPLWAGQPVGPPQPQTPPPPVAPVAPPVPVDWPGIVLALVFVLGLCLPFRPHARALELAGRVRSARVLIGFTVALVLVALAMYPRFGSDVFEYVAFERMWVVYGENPLLATPASHPEDWSAPLVWFPDQPPAYGPLWAILTWPLVRVAGQSAWSAVLGYKALALGAYVACCGLVWASAAPRRRRRAFVQFAWSPLVLFEVLGKVHNDVLIAVAALGAVALVRHGPGATGLALLGALPSGLIKATALAVAPPLAVRVLITRGWRALVLILASALLVGALMYLPFWAGWATLQPFVHQTGRLVWSPGTLLLLASELLPGGPFATPVRAVLGLVWLAACLAILRRYARAQQSAHQHGEECNERDKHRTRGDDAEMAAFAATSNRLLLLTVLLLTTAVFGHYFVPAVALAAVAADRHLERLVTWLSVGGLAAYGVEVLSIGFGPGWVGSAGYQLTGSLVLLSPALLAEVYSRASTRRGNLSRGISVDESVRHST